MVFDIAALAFTVIFSLIMMKRGGMRALLSLGSFILSIVVASMLYPVLTEAVYKTPLPENLEEIVKEALVTEESGEDMEAFDALPGFMKNIIEDTQSTVMESVSRTLAQTVTRFLINIIIFVLLVVATKLIISLLSGAMNIVTKLPVLHELNSLTGLVCGLAVSLVVVWIAVMATGAVATSNRTVAAWIENSYAVDIMSNISPF